MGLPWRLLTAVLVAAVGAAAGRVLARPYYRRWAALRELDLFLAWLEVAVGRQARPLPLAWHQYRRRRRTVLLEPWLAAVERGLGTAGAATVAEAFARADGEAEAAGLWPAERALLAALAGRLGHGDAAAQRRHLEEARRELGRLREAAEAEDLKQARVVQVLAAVAGLAMAIVTY
ncbi:MAG: hypothetical protein OWV35_04095 [Firmicutes bacterium]|nr:hypothetical protein [Bacillota bacterium]